YYEGSVEDITERKLTEDALRQSEDLLNEMGTIARIGGWEHDLVTGEAVWTRGTYEIVEIESGPVPGPNEHLDYYPPKDRAILEKAYQRSVETGEPFDLELQGTTAKGRAIWARAIGRPVFRDGRCVKMRGTFQDITERKRAEDELRKLAAVVKHSRELVNIATLEGKMLFLNEAGGRMLGIDPADVEQVNIMEVIPEHFRGLVQSELVPALNAGGDWEGDLQYRNLKTGELVDVHAMTFSINDPDTGRPLFLANVSLDITERKQTEEDVRRERDFAESLVDTAQAIVLVLDLEGRIVHFNRYMEELSGYRLDEVRGQDWFTAFLPPSDWDSISKLFKRAVAGIQTRGNVNPIVTRDGARREIEWYDKTLKSAEGTVVGVLAIGQDITERLRAEEALRESEERMELALRGADLGMWDWNVQTGAVTFNERWAEMLGYQRNEVEPHLSAWEKLVHPDDMPGVDEVLNAHLAGKTDFYESEHRLRHKSGDWVWVLDKGRVIERDAEGKPLRACGTHLDITERKQAEEERRRLEEQLRHSQKMEAIGQLAAGVAHEFNNLLVGILGNAELLLSETTTELPGAFRQSLEDINTCGERAAALTQQLLTFARKKITNVTLLDLNRTVAGLEKMIRRLVGAHVKVDVVLDQVPCTVRMDQGELEQVVLNLVINSRDALSANETLAIHTANVTLTEGDLHDHPAVRPGPYALLEVADTGCGMSEETVARIFEPFFTT
ncbi:MAG: PAS domain S-box protein, partial [Planctomycetes bacterium]|nr:PAS domain S-box protein [Planctomycetota bacterium]